MPICVPKRALARLRQFFARVDDIDRALLKLHCVTAACGRDAYQALCLRYVAVVVDSDLGDHVAGLPVADVTVPDSNCLSHAVRDSKSGWMRSKTTLGNLRTGQVPVPGHRVRWSLAWRSRSAEPPTPRIPPEQ